ncbi:MAG: zinc ribbon domain-containing protein [Kiritimatiellae bacterium]|nr:zinc ribbon domain-containing protein [Kiritimatiellia bacterium]
MPLYVYEAKDSSKGCARCRDGFETMQSLNDAKLETCPDCGAPVYRVIQAPGLGHSKTDLHYRAKRAGFHTLKRVNKGEYEKMY